MGKLESRIEELKQIEDLIDLFNKAGGHTVIRWALILEIGYLLDHEFKNNKFLCRDIKDYKDCVQTYYKIKADYKRYFRNSDIDETITIYSSIRGTIVYITIKYDTTGYSAGRTEVQFNIPLLDILIKKKFLGIFHRYGFNKDILSSELAKANKEELFDFIKKFKSSWEYKMENDIK